MLSLAITLLIVGLIAGILGLAGIGGTIMHIGWILLVVGLILVVIRAISGRRVV